jgi:2-amino-4-hydroxy-6-hydroxymethyldihydropteridine diphosphokinase
VGVRVAIGLGSNVGDRGGHLEKAIAQLERLGEITAVSSRYETAPIGGPRQGPYLNMVVVLVTDLRPPALLEALLAIERKAGRERRERWGPRTIDLDLLLYGDTSIDEAGLKVPHREMTRRRFVLEPLAEAWPDASLPDGTLLSGYLPEVADQEVEKLKGSVTAEDFPRWAPVALFLLVGLGAVAIWWLMDLVL